MGFDAPRVFGRTRRFCGYGPWLMVLLLLTLPARAEEALVTLAHGAISVGVGQQPLMAVTPFMKLRAGDRLELGDGARVVERRRIDAAARRVHKDVEFLRTGDERWPARLPMTKAAVRAMDAVQQFLASEAGGGTKIARWVVTGGSKRGWTTWTTAAVDRRVIAIIPAVIDLLNLQPSFVHHWRVYGFWAPAVSDYVEHGVMDWMGTPQFASLMKIVEPFEYRDRLTMPKFILNSAGDQFFVPDSSQFYFDQLPGEKYLRYVPNTDHGVTRRSDAAESLAAFYESVVRGWKRPQFSWTISQDGQIEVVCRDRPSAVKLWTATNPDARDFRVETIGRAYKSTDISPLKPGAYSARIPKPEKGFTAGFIELTFPTPGGSNWKFTTPVKVVPDVYPFPPPQPKGPMQAVEPTGR